MLPFFKDPDLQARFEKEQALKICVLTPDEVKALVGYYMELTGGDVVNAPFGVFSSFHTQTSSQKRETTHRVREIVAKALDRLFESWQLPFGTNFVVKAPDSKAYTYPHQDWLFMDYERRDKMPSMMMWISLMDLDVNAGSLGYVKGSAEAFRHPVGSPAPAVGLPVQGHQDLLFRHMTFPSFGAGEALIYDATVIHGALPNHSPDPRMALTLGISPKECDIYHYYLKPGHTDCFLKLRCERDFYYEYNNESLYALYKEGDVPNHCVIEAEIKYRLEPLDREAMERRCIHYGAERNNLSVCTG